MPTFYQRPLTWLLVAAFATFDALFLAGTFGPRSTLGLSGVVCQLFLVAQWVMFGSAHWLTRSATALLSIVLATLILVSMSSGSLSLAAWQRIVAPVALIVVSTLVGMLLTMSLKKLLCKPNSAAGSHKWQVSLIEMFGLTLVVACGSWLARGAAFARMLQHSDAGMWLGVPCLTGMALAAIGSRPTTMRWGGLAVSILAVSCLVLATPLRTGEILDLFVAIALLGVCLIIRSYEPTPIERDETFHGETESDEATESDDATEHVIPNERVEVLRAERAQQHLDEQV